MCAMAAWFAPGMAGSIALKTAARRRPFTEKIATYPVRLVEGRVQVSATPLPPGTYSEPVTLSGSASPEGAPA
jgi:hypothetical protein